MTPFFMVSGLLGEFLCESLLPTHQKRRCHNPEVRTLHLVHNFIVVKVIITLNNINHLVLVMETVSVYYEVRSICVFIK